MVNGGFKESDQLKFFFSLFSLSCCAQWRSEVDIVPQQQHSLEALD